MLSVLVSSLAFSRPAVLPMRPAPALVTSATPAPSMIFEGPALVSAANVILAMNLMPLGPTAYGLGMGGKQMSAGQKKWGDRAFGNTMEHFPLFNAALWLHAVYVSSSVATRLGIAYLCLVVMYPVIWALVGGEKGVPTKPYSLLPLFGPLDQIYYSTFPRYGIVFYLALSAVLKIAFGLCLNTIVKMPLIAATIGFGWFLYHYAYVAYPILHENVFSKCFAKA